MPKCFCLGDFISKNNWRKKSMLSFTIISGAIKQSIITFEKPPGPRDERKSSVTTEEQMK